MNSVKILCLALLLSEIGKLIFLIILYLRIVYKASDIHLHKALGLDEGEGRCGYQIR